MRDGDTEEGNKVALARNGSTMLDSVISRVWIQAEHRDDVVIVSAKLLDLMGCGTRVDYPHVLKFVTSALLLRRHIATRLLSKGTVFCKLGMYLERVLEHIASQWILSCSSNLLCISIAMSVTKFCTRGGCIYRLLSQGCLRTLRCRPGKKGAFGSPQKMGG
jgi:hypothetical protein